MNKTDLIKVVADKIGLKQTDAQAAVNAVFESVQAALVAGDKVSLPGFGTFEVRNKAARTVRNPATGEKKEIGPSKAPAWKAAKSLKDSLNN